jgi:enterochelin esterase-like enzyme
MWPVGLRLPCPAAYVGGLAALAAFLAVGLLGARGYVDNFLAYRGFAPPREPAYVRTPGTTQRILITSPALGGRRQEAYVYLPSGYAAQPHRRYPVLYLLHGFPGRPLAFLETVQMGIVDDSLTARRLAQPLILVMPFGSTGTFTDEEWVNGIRAGTGWATFVARDLVRAVDARYRTIAAARGRAIAGLSEGGYGAINIALHHPREFSVVESWSGYERPDKIRSVFGASLRTLAANDPRSILTQVAPVLRRFGTYFWFYSGSTDPLRKQNAAFARELTRAGISYRYFEVYGGHNWAIWRGNARAAYLVAAERLARA